MRERPILFSAPMVRALLDGSKTQTRRVLRDQPPATALRVRFVDEQSILAGAWVAEMADGTINTPRPCPYGEPGDRLWVRETFGYVESIYFGEAVVYKAGGTSDTREPFRWHPSIHMPRVASRITLAVESIRVERLHDITEEDARAEGVEREDGVETYRDAFERLWGEINGPESWDASPWVWVIGFKVVSR